jgi:membrane protein insertase Oxa1/YidC/SpoIIIJ
MRKFTNAEKQQLQAKIKDERERQYQAVRKIVRKNNEEPNKILFLLFFWDFFGFWSD